MKILKRCKIVFLCCFHLTPSKSRKFKMKTAMMLIWKSKKYVKTHKDVVRNQWPKFGVNQLGLIWTTLGRPPQLIVSVCAYHRGSYPRHNIYAFINSYFNCDVKRTKIKTRGPHLKNGQLQVAPSVTRKKSPNVFKSCPKMISLEK